MQNLYLIFHGIKMKQPHVLLEIVCHKSINNYSHAKLKPSCILFQNKLKRQSDMELNAAVKF